MTANEFFWYTFPMQPKSPFPLFSQESLRLVSFCPICNTHYNPLTAQILEEREDAHLVHAVCRKCDSSIVALVLTGGLGISSVGLVTDLNGQEVLKFRNVGAIHANDVIEAHQLLYAERDFLAHEL